eukprot:scaffold196_cov371-Prasinococcus_capsulatus_cf.AAC.30
MARDGASRAAAHSEACRPPALVGAVLRSVGQTTPPGGRCGGQLGGPAHAPAKPHEEEAGACWCATGGPQGPAPGGEGGPAVLARARRIREASQRRVWRRRGRARRPTQTAPLGGTGGAAEGCPPMGKQGRSRQAARVRRGGGLDMDTGGPRLRGNKSHLDRKVTTPTLTQPTRAQNVFGRFTPYPADTQFPPPHTRDPSLLQYMHLGGHWMPVPAHVH